MKCPVCGDADLVMADKQGVEIDYCPKCRGIWLDRGELDKLIERAINADLQFSREERRTSATQPAAPPPPPQQPYPQQQPYQQPYYRRDDDDDDDDDYKRHHYKKRKSFWNELFD